MDCSLFHGRGGSEEERTEEFIIFHLSVKCDSVRKYEATATRCLIRLSDTSGQIMRSRCCGVVRYGVRKVRS